MEEEKDKGFNPSDYDYMNHLPFEGWIWEFIRRNADYRKLYSEFKKPLPERDPYYRKRLDHLLHDFGIEANRGYDGHLDSEQFLIKKSINPLLKIKKKTRTIKLKDGTRKKSKSRIIDGNVNLGIPNPDIKYKDFDNKHKPIILTREPQWGIVKAHNFNEHYLTKYKQLSYEQALEDNDLGIYCVHTITRTLTPLATEIEDTLYLGISKKATLEDIKQEISKIYTKYIKPEFRKRKKEWPNYLMTYDLRKKKYTVKKIAKLLYPNEKSANEKIKKHIQTVKGLIDEKQYLKFLSLDISQK